MTTKQGCYSTVVTTSMEVDENDITIDGYVHFYVDLSYGADADGKRGEKRITVNDVTDISGYDEDMNSVPLTAEQKEKAANLLTKQFMEE